MEKEEDGRIGGECVCVCVRAKRKKAQGRKGSERMKCTNEAPGFHSDGLGSENTTAFVRMGGGVCVLPPHTDARRSC